MTNTQSMETAYRAIRRLSEAAEGGSLDALECLGVLRRELEDQTAFAVASLRDAPTPTPWATIGRALDVTRQAAQQRYGG